VKSQNQVVIRSNLLFSYGEYKTTLNIQSTVSLYKTHRLQKLPENSSKRINPEDKQTKQQQQLEALGQCIPPPRHGLPVA